MTPDFYEQIMKLIYILTEIFAEIVQIIFNIIKMIQVVLSYLNVIQYEMIALKYTLRERD
jgi:hypothetical protein